MKRLMAACFYIKLTMRAYFVPKDMTLPTENENNSPTKYTPATHVFTA
jgi:hypothetical protein